MRNVYNVATTNAHCIYTRNGWLLLFRREHYWFTNRVSRKERKKNMLGAQEQRSEVARLLSQISAEYEAAQRGLCGLSCGTAQHEFITKRMENMGQLHNELQSLVGDAAIAMIADELNNL